jgi:hypothetical protein
VATRMALLFLYLTRKSPVSGYAAG